MQTIQLDIIQKEPVAALNVKQGDVGRTFCLQIFEGGESYRIAPDAIISMWYSSTSGAGNYTMIGNKSPFQVNGNEIVAEMIAQMTACAGGGELCLQINERSGAQVGLWNIPYFVERVPGFDSEGAKDQFSAFSEVIAKFSPDKTLTLADMPAEAKAVGAALSKKVDKGEPDGCYIVRSAEELNYALLMIIGTLKDMKHHRCILHILTDDADLPRGAWQMELVRVGTNVQITGVCGNKRVFRTYEDSMLLNGSFEAEVSIPGWVSKDPLLTKVNGEKVCSGLASLEICNYHQNADVTVISEAVSVTGGEEYLGGAYVSGGGNYIIGIDFYDGVGKKVGHKSISGEAAEDWQLVTMTAAAPETAEKAALILGGAKESYGVLYFDNARLYLSEGGANLLSNPTFEAGVEIPGWQANDPEGIMCVGSNLYAGNGNTALKWMGYSTGENSEFASEFMDVDSGVNYTASMDISGGTITIGISYFDENFACISSQEATFLAVEGAWSHAHLDSASPVGAAKAKLVLSFPENGYGVMVDNVAMQLQTLHNQDVKSESRFSDWRWEEGANAVTEIPAVGSLEELSQRVIQTLKTMAAPESRKICLGLDMNGGSAVVTIHKGVGIDGAHEATALVTNSTGDILLGTGYDDSLAGYWEDIDWLWLNPPMEAGVEYKTAHRRNYRSVYVKRVNIGNLPASGSALWNTGISKAERPAFTDFAAYVSNENAHYPIGSFPYAKAYLWCDGENWFVKVDCVADCSGYQGEAVICYTKG
ncbi:MAG: hypothetical protein IJW94_02965 [Oscillospiraceae bacterium]|nr:hypothetical protein [Oscillospiraceae bacterium]